MFVLAHPNIYLSESHWTRLKYPVRLGICLMGFDILTWLGHGTDDARMHRPIERLLGARSPDGLWNHTGKPHAEADQWISLIALRAPARYLKGL